MTYEKLRLPTLKACSDLISENSVRLRGWDYPHVDRNHGMISGKSWVENFIDWDSFKELWRMYQSGQFLHLFGCREDWGKFRIFWSERNYADPGYALSLLSTLYTFTEIYEFASRITNREIFADGIVISVILRGMKNRRIVTSDIRRTLFESYICNLDEISLNRKSTINQIVEEKNNFAIEDTCYVFERFSWLDPPERVLKEEQNKFLKRS